MRQAGGYGKDGSCEQAPALGACPRARRRPVGRARHTAFRHIRHPKKRAFLRAVVETGTVVRAARAAGINRDTVYSDQWRHDREFQDALAQARVMAADLMEDEVYRRAVEGVKKPTGWHKGKPGGYIREYSDLVLMFSLKAVKPEYRDQVQAQGATIVIPDMGRLPQPIVKRIADGEDVGRAPVAPAATRGARHRRAPAAGAGTVILDAGSSRRSRR